MVQLSSLEFTEIGQLERDDATGEHFIAAFSSRLEQCPLAKVDAPPWPELALMSLFTNTLLGPRYNDGHLRRSLAAASDECYRLSAWKAVLWVCKAPV
ncbi:hypothetical protein EXIGLDRAFT_775730 [Exidia glandulosa HHB12029]|uniref:Uncharacterized protein n=1 Tax=Exidia glandulosa HHB12029 TaxID=1314781 RepID=A0A165DT73_EXIGL|nr:hypothetical protein EXIGLDRAFT_775730 [Exidia glandulosa HHB12029]